MTTSLNPSSYLDIKTPQKLDFWSNFWGAHHFSKSFIYSTYFLNNTDALCPPNPNEFDKPYLTSLFTALFGV